jgi:hypothetical protein
LLFTKNDENFPTLPVYASGLLCELIDCRSNCMYIPGFSRSDVNSMIDYLCTHSF